MFGTNRYEALITQDMKTFTACPCLHQPYMHFPQAAAPTLPPKTTLNLETAVGRPKLEVYTSIVSYFENRAFTCWVSPPPHSIARLLGPLISQKKLGIAGYSELFLLYYRTQ